MIGDSRCREISRAVISYCSYRVLGLIARSPTLFVQAIFVGFPIARCGAPRAAVVTQIKRPSVWSLIDVDLPAIQKLLVGSDGSVNLGDFALDKHDGIGAWNRPSRLLSFGSSVIAS